MRTILMLSAMLIGATMAVAQNQPSKPLTRSPASAFEQELINNQNQFMEAIADRLQAEMNKRSRG